MRAGEAVLWIDAVLVGGMASWALAVAYSGAPDYKILRRLFWAMAAGVAIFVVIWGVTTFDSFYARAAVAALAFGVTGILVVEGSRWTYREAMAVHHDLSPQLYLECSPAATPTFSASGKLYAFPAMGMADPGRMGRLPGGMAEYSGEPGSKFSLGSAVHFFTRCSVINYGKEPLIDISMDFPLNYRKAVSTGPNGLTSGDVIFSGKWRILIGKIDPGAADPFVFYLFHIGPQFVEVYLPETATCRTFGSEKETICRLEKPQSLVPIFLNPVDESKPQDGKKNTP